MKVLDHNVEIAKLPEPLLPLQAIQFTIYNPFFQFMSISNKIMQCNAKK